LLALTLGSFLGFLIFNLVYFVGDIAVFFIPCWLILSLWVGLGWLQISRYLAERIVQNKKARITDIPALSNTARQLEANIRQLLLIVLAALLLLFPLGLFFTRYSEIDQSHNTLARDVWQEILATDLPEGAILISNDRNEMMPMWYYQYVEARRPDWVGLFPLITPDPAVANVGRLLDQALSSGKPVYLIKPMPGLEIKADLTPLPPLTHTQLIAATSPKTRPDQPVSLTYADQLTLRGYDQIQSQKAITVTLYWQAETVSLAHDYTSYVHLIDANGQGKAQGQDHPPGGVFYPTSLWQPGETLRDFHTIPIPSTLSPGEYTLIAGLYRQPKPGTIEALGQAQSLGTVLIK